MRARLERARAIVARRIEQSPAVVALALVAAGVTAVYLHSLGYRRFFTDDGFISLRYTRRLLDGQGLTWTGSERVEGYSNFLWVLLCAVPGFFGSDLVQGARGLGLVCVAALFAAVIAAVRPARAAQWLAPTLAIALLSATDAVAVWSVGGLEPPLVGALVGWGIVTAVRSAQRADRRATIAAGLCFGLVCWARVDGALWGVAACVGLTLAFRRRALRTCVAVAGGVALFSLLQLAFRAAYYHDVLPNTAYAKVAFSAERLHGGIEHVLSSFWPLAASWLAFIFGVAQALRRPSLRGYGIVIGCLGVFWTLYLVRIGGDNFPAWRQLVYVVFLASLVLAVVLGEEWASTPVPAGARWGVTLVVLAAVGSRFDPGNWAGQEMWPWDGAPVGKMLGRAFRTEQPLIAVDAAGAIPYYSELPALDMLGLTDRYLAHHRPANIGRGLIGHELGDGEYYLRRAPDVVCFGVPPCSHQAKFPAQQVMVADPEFAKHYVPLRFEVGKGKRTLVSELWVRSDGRIGVRNDPSAVTIPAYFLARPTGATAELAAGGVFETKLPGGSRVSVEKLALSAGNWVVEPCSATQSGTITLTSKGSTLASGSVRDSIRLSLSAASSVDLELSTRAGHTLVARSIILRREAR